MRPVPVISGRRRRERTDDGRARPYPGGNQNRGAACCTKCCARLREGRWSACFARVTRRLRRCRRTVPRPVDPGWQGLRCNVPVPVGAALRRGRDADRGGVRPTTRSCPESSPWANGQRRRCFSQREILPGGRRRPPPPRRDRIYHHRGDQVPAPSTWRDAGMGCAPGVRSASFPRAAPASRIGLIPMRASSRR